MKRYKAYKESGVEWIGEIPSHWGLCRAKYMFNKEKREVLDTDDVVTCFRDGEVTLRKNRRTTGFTESLTEVGYQGVRKGDLVIHQMDAFAGSIGVSDSDGKCTSVYHCCTPKGNYDAYYYAHLVRLMAKRGYIQSLYRGIRERSSDFKFPVFGNQVLAVPPLHEQQVIVDYLKDKTLKIEQYVSARERERELFDSLKQSEIANIVAKGLNPKVKMKDSGISWIGEIPEHWTTRKIKFLFKERSEKGYPNEPVLCATQKYGVIPQSMYENRVVVVNKGLEGLKLVKEGDFVISLRSFQGGIEYAHYQGIISAAYTVLSPSDEVNPNYIKYLFKSHPFIELLKTCVTGIREGQNINFDLLRKSSIMLPPLSEQQAIVSYIDEKLQKIDQYMTDLQREIDYLKEFKQRLISDAVTGQLCVTKQ
ncbi:restriction endonuclease subunit S [uncultured Prevotella sp.]|uniref:restriction endonuclease subunit S n=1 Tax=uncultured Prevotella sp. TaxID=159272 RepID=UPI0025960075|nr:restriction endonuclease subunit S [uncultured Prevotella sp.]